MKFYMDYDDGINYLKVSLEREEYESLYEDSLKLKLLKNWLREDDVPIEAIRGYLGVEYAGS